MSKKLFIAAVALVLTSTSTTAFAPACQRSTLHSISTTTPTTTRSTHSRVSPSQRPNMILSMAKDPDAKKETTWERITGPKLFKTVTNWEGIHAVPLVPLRILTGLLMIHHGSEGGVGPANFGTPEFQGFVDYIMKPYFGFLPGSPEVWAAIHDYAEFYGGILFTLGF